VKQLFTVLVFLSLVGLPVQAHSHFPKRAFVVREISTDELEALMVSASRARPAQTVLELMMRLSNQLAKINERLVTKGKTWKEVLDRKKCSLGTVNNTDITQLLPLQAVEEMQFGATDTVVADPSATDAWVAVLDPKNPEVKNGVITRKFGDYKVQVGKSKKGERPLGTFGAAKHTYNGSVRKGGYTTVYGLMVDAGFLKAWLTGVDINGTKITAHTDAAGDVDLSNLTPIQCKETGL
jgi:hypothetical protein